MELDAVSFQFLQEITDGFSKERILGEGAFGVVYMVRFEHAWHINKYILNKSGRYTA